MCAENQNTVVFDAYEAEKQYLIEVRAENERITRESGVRPRAFIESFGCQQNEADSEKFAGMALEMGYEMTDTPSDADLIIVNTCAVREHAEKRALSEIGQFKKYKEQKKELLIGVGGCMVSQEHRVNQIRKSYPYVDFVFGTSSFYRIPELIAKRKRRSKRIFCSEAEYVVPENLPVRRGSDYRAWVSVMYGCNNFCTYCIVPYVRGRERSRNREDIIKEVRGLIEAGYKDITLLGQNVNSYGKDRGDGYTFPDLLEELAQIPGDYYLRFMTSHPKDASDRLIEVMAKYPRIAKCFHLPLQAGSDDVLRRMNRRYTFDAYDTIIEKIRAAMPDCVITSDIMVGFPGETDADFEDTMKALERVRFDMAYEFIYSPREGTPASKEEQIPGEVKSARFDRLLKLETAISTEKNQALVGKTVRVLCDGISKTDAEVYCGRTEGNKIVFFAGLPEDRGTFLHVRIDSAEGFALRGEVIR